MTRDLPLPGGRPPIGPAGGALAGDYPEPRLSEDITELLDTFAERLDDIDDRLTALEQSVAGHLPTPPRKKE